MAEFLAIELAEYIERGLAWVEGRSGSEARVTETAGKFLRAAGDGYRAGALGLAFLGKAGGPQAALEHWAQFSNASQAAKIEAAAGILGVSEALTRLVDMNHRNGVPAAEIATSLRMGTLTLAFRAPPAARPKAAAAGHSAAASPSRQLLRESRVGTQQAGF